VSTSPSTVPRALLWATDIDVLPLDRVLVRRDRYLVVRSPSNPEHHWGNLLLFEEPPGEGDGERWERRFEDEFGDDPEVRHRTFGWDVADGPLGSAQPEFVARGYELESPVGLVANARDIHAHPRENREIRVRPLDAAPGADDELWEQVVELQVANDEEPDRDRDFRRRRLGELRELFEHGRGAWYVALDRHRDEVLGSCGVVVTGERGRFQAVDTAAAHRRRGICSRLVVAAAHDAAERFGARRLVIAADPEYHALGLYESLGFERRERVSGVCRRPPACD
jgi:ribosomal protein S18 acetylase RimI-like enzyme